ncbi:uncharacterized protein LOC131025028 isoform X2 [Salvia miltiorrhiza]|uniref:uncharacterized protein LOC131025028 isoform X2 n=1 Tax=Salvia miltiorrhiza TaxID=226208 RepID=UPI0025AD3B85|nr:uncharacterized protein LOC131025028 isoform X2 [Salvia miltiorrhiza]XP_057810592.1 uncharacterized protein LOC131025028 isoform X2 [Salvia miltiorrhiza]
MGWKSAQKLIHHWKILRGDNIMIIRGKDKGETGVVKRVVRSQNRVIVEGKNLVKKHIKQGQGHEGGIFSVEAPLHVSNVQVVDPVTAKPCKVGIKYLEDGSKVRVARGIGTSGAIIPRPEILKMRTTPRPTIGNFQILAFSPAYLCECFSSCSIHLELDPAFVSSRLNMLFFFVQDKT